MQNTFKLMSFILSLRNCEKILEMFLLILLHFHLKKVYSGISLFSMHFWVYSLIIIISHTQYPWLISFLRGTDLQVVATEKSPEWCPLISWMSYCVDSQFTNINNFILYSCQMSVNILYFLLEFNICMRIVWEFYSRFPPPRRR